MRELNNKKFHNKNNKNKKRKPLTPILVSIEIVFERQRLHEFAVHNAHFPNFGEGVNPLYYFIN